MSDQGPDRRKQLEDFVRNNKLAVGIGGAVLLVLAFSGGGETSATDPSGGGGSGPYSDGGGAGSGGSGEVDMDAWRRRERADDEAQRRRIESIREEERCRNSDGTVDTVSVHTGC